MAMVIGPTPPGTGNGGRLRKNAVIVGVAAQPAVRAVDAHVNDDGALFDHIARHHARTPHGKEQEIGAAAFLGKIGRPRMAQRHRGVAKFAGTGQQQGQRLAHDIGTPHDHGLFTARGQVVAAQQLDNARRRAGNHTRQPEGEPPHVLGMEAVHILGGIDGQQAAGGVQPGGQRQLQQNAVHIGAGIQLGNQSKQRLLRGIGGQAIGQRENARILAGPFLIADIDLRCGVLPYQNDGKSGGAQTVLAAGGDFFLEFGAHGLRRGLSINNRRHDKPLCLE